MNFHNLKYTSKLIQYSTLVLLLFSIIPITSAQNSVLADGQILKLKIEQNGIHKITFQALQEAGLNPSTINPNNIQLFGNGGGMLPQANAVDRISDLRENAIFLELGGDGTFNQGDYILFYAQAADSYQYDEQSNDALKFSFEKNLYDDFNYYYLKVGNQAGKRIQTAESLNGGTKITTYDEIAHHELDEVNIIGDLRNSGGGGSGRMWFGERFDFVTEATINFEGEGLVTSRPVLLRASAMAYSSRPSEYTVSIAGQNIGTLPIAASIISTYSKKGDITTSTFQSNISSSSSTLPVTVAYNKTDNTAFGHLDYLTLSYTRNLSFYKQNTHFRSVASIQNEVSSFEFSQQPASMRVWNITDVFAIQEIPQNTSNLNAFTVRTGNTLNELIAFDTNTDLPVPLEITPLANQNLHALPTPDFVIVTHTDFIDAAQKLAAFHNENDNLEVLVVTVDQIWNEFSSGKQDISAIRDFVRFLYKNDSDKLRYLLLFGDTSYDYKDRISSNNNFVPVYQSRESLEPVETFSSEDFFGLLEDNEGIWGEETNTQTEDLDIGIGRIPVRSATQASQVVDKIIGYSLPQTLGKWRNKVVFVADDGDNNIHMRDSEEMIEIIESYKGYQAEKLYIDAFPQISTSNGKFSFKVREKLSQNVNEGSLIVNYMGHGSESSLATEAVVDLASISNWKNLDNLPLFVTATCEFGRYDNPDVISAGERLMTNEDGGGIALVTTTRPVTASTNFVLAKAFYSNVFKRLPNGEMPRLGDIIRKTKNESLAKLNRNFTLLGDPALRLNYPKEEAVITEVKANGTVTESIKALDKVTLTGEIVNNNTLSADFTGILDVVIYDKPAELRTYGDESRPMFYNAWQNVLYKGKATINQGKFEITFVVSKDINYNLAAGRVTMYAQHETQNRDANGFYGIQIGASNNNAPTDNTPPTAQIWIEDKTFVSGAKVPSNTVLLAEVSDESGINLSGYGVGREITAVVDGEASQTFILNDYFTYDEGSYTKGTITFPLEDLSVGQHTLSFTVWDNYSNPTTIEVDFYVENKPIELTEITPYPNPFWSSVNFDVTHTRKGDDIEVVMVVYDVVGRAVRTIRQNFIDNQGSFSTLSWNGRGNEGEHVKNGMYICKIYIRSLQDGAVGTNTVKVVLNR
ncbi:type IX secretion system sortase PorU [Bernardetia sp.]|uniref:type IX secretion system sortase PorU n=1 Tax=Bernardetia sp. TaxID=1937974 RepID=UPI0025BBE003|nr:type IX secretion system sortase PorU [Bernardetia sp.]